MGIFNLNHANNTTNALCFYVIPRCCTTVDGPRKCTRQKFFSMLSQLQNFIEVIVKEFKVIFVGFMDF